MKKIYLIPIIILSLILIIFLTRLILPKEIDDVSPRILCEKEYLEKVDVLWVIPNFNENPISENKKWCKNILGLNKTLGMHGVYHTYNEFDESISQEYLQEGIDIFEGCFGFKPELFKPPQLVISKENKVLVRKNNIKVKSWFNQITHKVYHCEDSGIFSNRFVDLF
ncbi:DUF2334 domain-containing protein [Nanoarchaeota archaeon]